MKTKNQFTNRILSLVLALVMVVGLMPMTSFAAETVRAVASEAPTWDELGSITYTDGATQYLLYENRLYKIAYTNIKDSTRIAFIRVGSGESKILAISYNGLGFLYQANNYQARTEHMPKTPGESLECYPDSATAGYIVEKDKPVVIITCMAVGDPTWTWNGTSSATATFTSTDGNAQMTVNATVTSSTQTAESCLEKNQITYTATATANGKQYTTTKTVDGEQGPHSYAYSSLGNTVTETCSNGCPNADGGSVTLNVADAYYTGSAIGATVEGSFTNGATYKVTYNDSETVPSSIGTHIAKLTVYENGTEKQSVTAEYKISYLGAPNPAYTISGAYEDNGTYWFKTGASVTVNAPDGYTVSTALNDTYGSSVSFSEGDNKVIYLKRTSDGALTDKINVENIYFDGNGATGKITIESRGFWEKLFNKITFSLFFKGDAVAKVSAMDNESGYKSIQYYVSDKDLINDGDASALETAIGSNWNSYNNEITLNKNAKNVIYVKITDNVGHVTYLSSEGIVLYSDAEADTESVSTTYGAGADKDVSVKLNGNTVKEIKNGTTVLTKDTDYSVSADGTITLKADYLDALGTGTYTFTVFYNPLGETYVAAEGNDAPATTTFKVVVEKADGKVSNINISGKTYDGTAVTALTYDKLGNGVVTIEYKVRDTDDNTYTTTAPKNAGDYVVRVTAAEGTNHKAASATAEFSITTASIENAEVTLDPNTVVYNGSEHKPAVTVTWNGITLTENTDYVVYYRNNVNASDATVLGIVYVVGSNNFEGSIEKEFEITYAQLTEVEVKQQGTLTYNGQEQTPIVSANAKSVDGSTVIFTYRTSPHDTYGTMPDFTNAGTYTVYFKASAPNHNYVTGSFTVTVDKADQAAPIGIGKTDETIFGKDDGVILNVDASMEFRKEGETTYRACTGDRVIDLASGTYYVRYKGSDNYNPSPDQAVTIGAGEKLKIVVPQNPVGYTVTVNKTEIEYEGSYTLKVEIKEGYTATEDFKILISNWECGQQPNVEETYMNAIADQIIEVHGVADITPPNVEIDIKGNKWTSFWNNLTFGFFFKETQDVTITANDAGTGVKTVQYYLSDREMERDEVRAITDWVDYNGTFKINPDYKYVVYAKVADNDGNVAYINSAGIVLYSDSTLDTTIKDKITYVLTKNAEQAFTLNLNGNTVAYVKIDNIVLGNEDYEVLGNMVFISDEVLENLSAGEYTVTVGINPMGETFVDGDAPAEIAIPLFVEKAVVAIDIFDFDKVYDGTPASAEYKISKSSDSSPAASNIVYNEKVEYKAYGADDSTYTETAPVNAGKYTVRITVAETDKITSATETADFTIAKANYNMKGAKWNYTAPFQYDGKVHKVEVVGLPTGVTVESYENNTATTVGDYYAEVNLAYDANNYNAPTINKLGWTIYNDWTPAEYTVTAQNANGWLNENFFIKANEGYLVSFSDNADDFRSDSLACMTQEENIEITFYLQNIRTGAISLGKTVVCSIDKTVPTGKVEFVNRTGWEEFLNTITFNLFYKDEVTIKVTADDNLSGIDKIEYASSDKAITMDEVKAITNWTEYTDSFGVTLEDAKKFVYFVRITDKAGNVTYLSTDGAEYDTKAPVIEGIENGKTYYTTQKVTVTDKNIDSITLNGDTAGNEITLEGNKEAIYTIIATDKAGNSTTVTVMMKPISDLSAPIDTLTKDNVNSSNEGVVDEVKADVAAVDTTNATDAEKQALKDIADKAAELKKVIDDTVAENDRISDAVDGYDLATVTSDDKDDLEQLLADIEKQLASTNLTEEEVSELNGDKKAVEDLLDTIEDEKKALDDAKAALAELNKPAEPHSPATGDNSNIWLWFALLFVSSTGVFGITLYDRKRKVANKR